MLSAHLSVPLTVCPVTHSTHTSRVPPLVEHNSLRTGMTHLPGYTHRLFHTLSLLCHAKNAAMLVVFFFYYLSSSCSAADVLLTIQ